MSHLTKDSCPNVAQRQRHVVRVAACAQMMIVAKAIFAAPEHMILHEIEEMDKPLHFAKNHHRKKENAFGPLGKTGKVGSSRRISLEAGKSAKICASRTSFASGTLGHEARAKRFPVWQCQRRKRTCTVPYVPTWTLNRSRTLTLDVINSSTQPCHNPTTLATIFDRVKLGF